MSQTISVSELLDYQAAEMDIMKQYAGHSHRGDSKALSYNLKGKYIVQYSPNTSNWLSTPITKYVGTNAKEAVNIYNNL